MTSVIILAKALLTIHLLCAIFNLIMMIAPLTSKDLHDEIVDDMKKRYPNEGTPSRKELFFVCTVLAPFMTHWIITDILAGEKK